MSMNVGAIMRALLGDGQPADSRALELKVGQIVRGVLLEMLDEGEAVIQINGVHVRARLDTELPVGKGTLLQVQQPAAGGEIVLKALADPAELPPDETMKDVVKSFGLPEQKWSFELLRGLKRDGYPIDKMTAAWFRQAAETLPAGADPQEWMNAAGVAFRRGLEPTETTIASLRQTLYGPPVGERLDQLQAQLTAYLERPGDSSEQTKALAARALQLLAQGNALLAQGGEQLSAPPRSAVPAAGPQPAPQSAGEGLKPADARMAAGRDESAAAGEESRAPRPKRRRFGRGRTAKPRLRRSRRRCRRNRRRKRRRRRRPRRTRRANAPPPREPGKRRLRPAPLPGRTPPP